MVATEAPRPKTTEKGNKKGDIFKDATAKLSDENLRFLDLRLKHRLTGDVADAVILMSSIPELDRHLSSAKGANEFYDIIDAVQKAVERESRRRHS